MGQMDRHSQMFMRNAMRAELLDVETEQALARAWRDHRDENALHRMVTAYMRLAVSMAVKFRRYGVPVNDLVQEAGLGLMKAAEKFDPDRGVRFSTYAAWWIKAAMQEHVMRNWSMVRLGSTAAQKSLFFNLKRVEASLLRDVGADMDAQQLTDSIAAEIGVPSRDVAMMQGRLSGGDYSLNAVQGNDEDGREWIETLEDESAQGADAVDQSRDGAVLRHWLAEALGSLNEREQMIVRQRRLRDEGRTLDMIGKDLGISKERVRQLEVSALAKMREKLEQHGAELRGLLA